MYRFPTYVPVAARRAKAARKVASLRKQGKKVQPVEITGNLIARSFWGKRWCKRMESFSDYRNRLPRGRSYARHGAVCDLAIRAGRVDALVFGTRLYRVSIRIEGLKPAIWKSIKTKCTGQIGSVLELLQGKLSDQVMDVVTDRRRGLFPTPRQIEFDCNCPDWAGMCKHVASVLYGVGNRLDDSPELLFLLRKVDESELIDAEMALPAGAAGTDSLEEGDLSGIFGIDLDTDDAPAARSRPRRKASRNARERSASRTTNPRKRTGKRGAARKSAATKASARKRASTKTSGRKRAAKKAPAAPPPFRPTGARVRGLRRRSRMSVADFAATLGVSPATVRRWESARGPLTPQVRLARRAADPERTDRDSRQIAAAVVAGNSPRSSQASRVGRLQTGAEPTVVLPRPASPLTRYARLA